MFSFTPLNVGVVTIMCICVMVKNIDYMILSSWDSENFQNVDLHETKLYIMNVLLTWN